MSEEKRTQEANRREFLNRAGKIGLTAPATALLLSVTNKRAHATYSSGSGGHGGKPHEETLEYHWKERDWGNFDWENYEWSSFESSEFRRISLKSD